MKFKIGKVIVWQKAIEIGEEVFIFSAKILSDEKFNFTSQVGREVDSVAMNNLEGSIGQSIPELRKFIGYSIRSLAELVTCLYNAKNRKYLSENVFERYCNSSCNLMNQLIAYRDIIK